MISEKNSPEYCVEHFDQFIEKVTSHFTFAKIVLSLPFLTVRNVELNEKILKCVVLLQYKYIDNTIVTVCENTGLSARGNAVKRFFSLGWYSSFSSRYKLICSKYETQYKSLPERKSC